MSKASDRFTCVCCQEPHSEAEASYDDQFGGPVCEGCRKLSIKAVAWLKHAGIPRPFTTEDIDNFNCNRIKNYYK